MKNVILESGNCILIGQNATENFKLIDEALPNDLWFHLKQLPSCHVILKAPNFTNQPIFTEKEIKLAAELCLANTKFHGLNSVYVEFLPVKHVEKTSILGKVTLKRRPTLIKLTNGISD